MQTMQIIGFSAIGILFAISSWLILWCDYEDGIIGKAALALISVGCLVRLIELTEDDPFEYSEVSVLVLVGVALFFMRHLWRTYQNVKRSKNDAHRKL